MPAQMNEKIPSFISLIIFKLYFSRQNYTTFLDFLQAFYIIEPAFCSFCLKKRNRFRLLFYIFLEIPESSGEYPYLNYRYFLIWIFRRIRRFQIVAPLNAFGALIVRCVFNPAQIDFNIRHARQVITNVSGCRNKPFLRAFFGNVPENKSENTMRINQLQPHSL